MNDDPDTPLRSLTLEPIGVVRTPFQERSEAPRQPRAALGVPGRIELRKGLHLEDALADLDGWSHVWVIFWFHRNEGWKPKVVPPRSTVKRGVLATRAPHRPNPLGLSVLGIERVEGLTVHVRDVDLLDGTPVFDLKPYVAWTDAIPDARAGWLDDEGLVSRGERPPDPRGSWEVRFGPRARAQLDFLAARGVALEADVVRILGLGPQPHAYRRIRALSDGTSRLGFKEWRIRFRVEGFVVDVLELESGYRRKERSLPEHALHAEFDVVFG